jgi:FKBP-type peptidyl-prolyl cis-trans isomerase
MSLRRLSLALPAVFLGACLSGDSSGPEGGPVIPLEQQVWASSLNINLSAMTKLGSGVYYLDTTAGTGAVLTGTPTIRFYYSGYLANGTRFDTNVGQSAPASYPLTQLISGWNSGLQGMKVGGKRRLVIPSALGYGPTGSGPIPPNANLVFDVDLAGIG